MRYWLPALNAVLCLALMGAFAAPLLALGGLTTAATAIYDVYGLVCHQWAFRSFFLFGDQVVYGQAQLAELGFNPYAFVGQPGMGWKTALCERDLAIYLGLLLVGMWYAHHGQLIPLSLRLYAILILPMAIDGLTQILGWRESTWQLRISTGLVFGLASAWLLYPRFDVALGVERSQRQYAAAETQWAPPLPRG